MYPLSNPTMYPLSNPTMYPLSNPLLCTPCLTPHSVSESISSTDAMSKLVYDRLFTWLVKQMNTCVHRPVSFVLASLWPRGGLAAHSRLLTIPAVYI
jgi:hypothetical protein